MIQLPMIMKASLFRILILAMIALIACRCASYYRKLDERREKKEMAMAEGYGEMKKLVHEGRYIFTATRVHPLSFPPVNVRGLNYFLSVNFYDVEARLPYYGRMHSYDPRYPTGIRIKGKLEDIMIEESDFNRRVKVSFSVRTKGEKFRISMDVLPEGSARLTVSSAKRSSIVYYGNVSVAEEEEEEEEPAPGVKKK